ncbi:hypothetical protein SASPL_146330 [Salvia splendens]|uniref:Disease resistance protein RPM1 n=1 Tax=Salvia splendens TaxID=180675 RepID=A0A8X8WCK0_SALSN|nr:hypothetical protein SASPL_146330 [Salvia splendens]
MAYNLQSLLTILQQILDPQQTCWKFDHNKPQLQSLFEKVESLLQILEKPSLTNILPSKLESRIRDASYKAEDIIESHMVYQKLSNPQSPSLTFSTPDLQQVTEELDLAMEQVQKLMERKKTISTSLSSSSGASSSHDVQLAIQQLESVNLVEVVEKKMPALWTSKNNLVGVDADMLQILDIMGMLLEEFPEEILQLVNLRYLAINCSSGLPDGMSRLHNLQTLICPHFMRYVTSELWEMYELIHIKFAEFIMKIKKIKFDLKKLQTLYIVWITPKLISSGFFEGIPNIIKLGIYYEDSPNIEVDLSHLHKLEILLCESQLDKDGSRFLHKLRFPSNLRKLSLLGCVVFRSLLTTLCTLPNLEVLRIMDCPFEREGETAEEEEEEWEVTEGDQFRSRLFLLLQFLNLVRWKANETNFPKLRKLHVLNSNRLEEIPSAIGDISTLQEISIVECGASIVASAQQIIKEQQEEYDNFDLKLYIPILRWRRKRKGFCGLEVQADETLHDPNQESDAEENFFKASRKQAEERVERSVVKVQAMFRSRQAQEEYRRMKLECSQVRWNTKNCSILILKWYEKGVSNAVKKLISARLDSFA